MKLKFKPILLILISSAFLFSSCNDDDEEPVVFVINEEDAAEFVAVILSVNTYGFSSNAIRFSEDVVDNLSCGSQMQESDIINETSSDGTISYSYDFTETYSYSCDTEGGSVSYSFLAEQQLTTLRSDVDSNIAGIWTVTDIDNSEPSYNLSGIYDRSSDWDSKTDELPPAFIITDLSFTDLKVDKSSGDLVGGSAQFELSGSQIDTDGQMFQGIINFSDPEATEVVFTNGGTYILNMRTGEVNKVS